MDPRKYQDLVQRYPVQARAEFLVGFFNEWVKGFRYPPRALLVMPEIVHDVAINYFADIDRLKHFHGLERVNTLKIAAYTASWWMRLRPIQIVKLDAYSESRILLANEYFAISIMLSFLYDRASLRGEAGPMGKLLENFLYHLRHRFVDPQVLELALESLLVTAPFDRTDEPPVKHD
jgi:hypothetical protein